MCKAGLSIEVNVDPIYRSKLYMLMIESSHDAPTLYQSASHVYRFVVHSVRILDMRKFDYVIIFTIYGKKITSQGSKS